MDDQKIVRFLGGKLHYMFCPVVYTSPHPRLIHNQPQSRALGRKSRPRRNQRSDPATPCAPQVGRWTSDTADPPPGAGYHCSQLLWFAQVHQLSVGRSNVLPLPPRHSTTSSTDADSRATDFSQSWTACLKLAVKDWYGGTSTWFLSFASMKTLIIQARRWSMHWCRCRFNHRDDVGAYRRLASI